MLENYELGQRNGSGGMLLIEDTLKGARSGWTYVYATSKGYIHRKGQR